MSDWLASLRALLPPGRVSSDLKELRRHASDAWSVAIKVRQQDRDTYQPQAVAYPHDQDEVARLLEWAHERRIAITPWGAGSSVTGAPLPLTGGVTVDLSRMDAPASIDRVNLLVTAQAGVRGDRLERALNDAGLTLGHSPQSLDRSTVGGWVATRATGQFSSRYGGIEDLVVALTAVLPTGEVVQTQPAVRPPFGPDVNALFIGAEGTLGIVTQVTLRVVPLPAARLLEAVRFASVDAGLDAMRSIMQAAIRPFVLRFYDQDESRHVLHDAAFRGCVMFLGCEGVTEIAEAEQRAALGRCSAHGGTPIGAEPVAAWMERRFDFSAVENRLNEPSGIAETIEVSHRWDGIAATYRALKAALAPHAAEVLGHFSHAYPQGTSLYMIVLGAAPEQGGADAAAAEATLRRIWEIALTTALEAGAAVAHHHGAGIARLPVIREGLGTAMTVLERVKDGLDPHHILCPGKLALSARRSAS